MIKSKSFYMSLAATLAALALNGCVERERVVVREGPGGPVVRERVAVGVSLTPLVCTERVIVRERPPKPRVEVMRDRPSPEHVWIGGHWYWHENAWLWVGGCWTLPPHRGAIWVPGHWAERHGEWDWVPGHWRRE